MTHSTAKTKTRAAGVAAAGRVLQLANPLMTGPDVTEAQRLLTTGPYGNFHPGTIDGEYGRTTAAATKHAKWALGYPDHACNDSFGPKLALFLAGAGLPAELQARREERIRQTSHHPDLRAQIVDHARWAIAHEREIHYDHTRPIQGIGHPRTLPLHVDCSAFVTLCYNWAGAPDPNGVGYDGRGFTGTMLTACRRIPQSAVQPGDLVVWGPGDGEHVALVLQAGDDPLLASHGQERGPLQIAFSAETKFHSKPVAWLTHLT